MTLSPCIDQDYEGWFFLVKIFFHYFEGADASVDLHELCGFPNSKGEVEHSLESLINKRNRIVCN